MKVGLSEEEKAMLKAAQIANLKDVGAYGSENDDSFGP